MRHITQTMATNARGMQRTTTMGQNHAQQAEAPSCRCSYKVQPRNHCRCCEQFLVYNGGKPAILHSCSRQGHGYKLGWGSL